MKKMFYCISILAVLMMLVGCDNAPAFDDDGVDIVLDIKTAMSFCMPDMETRYEAEIWYEGLKDPLKFRGILPVLDMSKDDDIVLHKAVLDLSKQYFFKMTLSPAEIPEKGFTAEGTVSFVKDGSKAYLVEGPLPDPDGPKTIAEATVNDLTTVEYFHAQFTRSNGAKGNMYVYMDKNKAPAPDQTKGKFKYEFTSEQAWTV